MPATIKPTQGDILLDKKGNYYRVITYCRHTNASETLIVYEALVSKQVWATPVSMFTDDMFTVAIKAEDLQS